MIRMLLSVWLAVVLMACEKQDDRQDYEVPEGLSVLFEYHYINHAWGFQENGWLIDSEGTIRSFDKPVDYKYGMHEAYLSLEDLEYNLGQTDSVVGHVESDILNGYVDLIPGAAEGEIGDAKAVMADAGAKVLSCYMYDPEEDAYLYVLLGQSGDWEQVNHSEEAEALVDWLIEFGIYWFSD